MADDQGWMPRRMELAFGLDQKLGRDAASLAEAVALDIGLRLRGSIDLVEEGPGGAIRATDYKTGKAKVDKGQLIEGGKSLQPALYALVLEKLFPQQVVQGGRLYYCTTRGDFTEISVPLDEHARNAVTVLANTLREYLSKGFFPAAPAKDECTWCDYKRVCGPYEQSRLAKKTTRDDRLVPLDQLRRTR
jgi:CRISPR/Cas system-associated exonuclease Cas4 (RecB family)